MISLAHASKKRLNLRVPSHFSVLLQIEIDAF
jgi:hypothetical protein